MPVTWPKFFTLGGGKGGVGRSFLAASIAAVLARTGRRVVAVDADLGSSNLHLFLGSRSHGPTLTQHLSGNATAADVMTKTLLPGLYVLTCAGDFYGAADPDQAQVASLLAFIAGLDADHVVVDVGAGTSGKVIDFFNLADDGIVVVSPDPAAIHSAYGFIRSALVRRIRVGLGDRPAVAAALQEFEGNGTSRRPPSISDFYSALRTDNPAAAEQAAALVDSFRPFVLVNMAEPDDEQRVVEILQGVTRRFLDVDLRCGGRVGYDPLIRRAGRRFEMLDFDSGSSGAACQISQAVLRLGTACENVSQDGPVPPPSPLTGLNDNIRFLGKELHIQTEGLGSSGRFITTQVFFRGRVIHSRRTEYPVGPSGQADREAVLESMRRQHFEVIRDLESRKEGALPAD